MADTIGQRIREFRTRNKITMKQLADIIGISQGSLSDIENNKTSPSSKTLENIVRNTDISSQWLLTGEEPMDPTSILNTQLKEMLTGPSEKRDFNEILEKLPRVGAGDPVYPEESSSIPYLQIPEHLVRSTVIALRVKGDSMYPNILEDAVIGVDIEDKKILSGYVYCINLPYEGAIIKRVFSEGEKIVIKSDNPIFPKFSMTYEEMKSYNHSLIIGRVKYIFQTY